MKTRRAVPNAESHGVNPISCNRQYQATTLGTKSVMMEKCGAANENRPAAHRKGYDQTVWKIRLAIEGSGMTRRPSSKIVLAHCA